jgi:hypothetical protein
MRWKTSSLILGGVVVLVLVSACGVTPQSQTATTVTTGAVSPHLQIATRVAKARAPTGKATSVSASCQPGEQLLGGGFSSSNLFEYAATIAASYPSSATTWTVTAAAPSSYFDVEAAANCLPAMVPFNIQVVRAAGTTGATVTCPQGTVLLSGGAQSSQPMDVSQPQGNGWMAASARASTQVYALCTARHGLRSQVVTSVFNAHSSSHNYAPGGGSVTCPAGWIATGGGFVGGGDLIVGSQAMGSAFAGWSVVAGGEADVTIAGVCWILQG